MHSFERGRVDMDGRELRIRLLERSVADARDAEMVRAFLIDLEHEYSELHRQAFEAHWGLSERVRSSGELGRELGAPEEYLRGMLEEALL